MTFPESARDAVQLSIRSPTYFGLCHLSVAPARLSAVLVSNWFLGHNNDAIVCQNGSTVSNIISASPNKEFEIILEGVPTAGYSWELVGPPEKEGVVQELGHEWQPSSSRVGGPAQEHFRFRALAAGEVHLRFRYRRPWEKGFKEERTFQVRVTSN